MDNFDFAGITRSPVVEVPTGYRLVDRRTPVASERAIQALTNWDVKKRVGFRVTPGEIAPDATFTITLGPVREPVRIAWVAANGFGYVTQRGHPLSGEEAFLIETDAAGNSFFVNRSVSRPEGAWRAVAPLLALAQQFFVRRYSRVMRSL